MFDSQTTLLLCTLLFLLLPAMVWLILPRPIGRQVGMWCLASVMAGAGIVLLGLRGKVPVVVSFHLANTLIMGYLVCCVQSLRMTLQQAWTLWGWLGRMLLVLLLYSALYEWASEAWRGALYRLVLGFLALYSASWGWRMSKRIDSFNAATIATAHLLVGLALVPHSLWMAGQLLSFGALSNSWDTNVISLVGLLVAVVTHLSYVGLALDLTARESLQALEAQQAAAQTELLGSQITHLDRRGRMAIVSSSLAHELNQPLTAATTNAQLAERMWSIQHASSPVLLDFLDKVEAAIERTVQILQRIRGGQVFAQHHGKVDLQGVLDRTLALMATELQRQSVLLAQHRSPSPVWCWGDELGLSQVVINLLRNAMQAMAGQADRRLWVGCDAKHGQARLVVRDGGPGMPAEIMAHWGEPFRSTRDAGMGLGLAISREIVARHKGQLLLTNRPEGGLEAVVVLPMAAGVQV